MKEPYGWKEFQIGDIFDIKTPKKRFYANTVKFGGKYPYVARSGGSNGIRGYITEDTQYLNPANTISYGQDTATMFYQEQPYFTGDKIKVMTFRPGTLTKNLAFYLISSMNRAFTLYSWGQTSFSESALKKVNILLPITADGMLNLNYMEEYISEVKLEYVPVAEQHRENEHRTYLKCADLNDDNLSDNDCDVLKWLTNGRETIREFRTGDLFTADTGNVDIQQTDVDGKGEYFINSGAQNIGIKGRTSRPAKIFPANTITVDFWGHAYYRGFSYKLATHNHVFSLSGDCIKNERVGMYLASMLSKWVGYFSFDNMLTWTLLKDMVLMLPCKTDGSLDFDFMERYICAVEKQVIKQQYEKRKQEIDIADQLISKDITTED